VDGAKTNAADSRRTIFLKDAVLGPLFGQSYVLPTPI
jgi:hypothetical protein